MPEPFATAPWALWRRTASLALFLFWEANGDHYIITLDIDILDMDLTLAYPKYISQSSLINLIDITWNQLEPERLDVATNLLWGCAANCHPLHAAGQKGKSQGHLWHAQTKGCAEFLPSRHLQVAENRAAIWVKTELMNDACLVTFDAGVLLCLGVLLCVAAAICTLSISSCGTSPWIESYSRKACWDYNIFQHWWQAQEIEGVIHIAQLYRTKALLYMKKFCPHRRPAQKTAAKCTLIPQMGLQPKSAKWQAQEKISKFQQLSSPVLDSLSCCWQLVVWLPRILAFGTPGAEGMKTDPAGSKSSPSWCCPHSHTCPTQAGQSCQDSKILNKNKMKPRFSNLAIYS